MKRIYALFGLLLLMVIFSIPNKSFAQSNNPPKVDFSVNPSQNVIVKPQDQNALGNLDVHLTPSGKSTNANRDPIDVVFIFDKSGSMDESGKNPQKFKSAKNAMAEAVSYFKKNAGPNDRFAFISFSSDVEQVVNFSPTTINEGLDKINQTAQSLTAKGGTNYTQSFEKAIELLDGSQNNKYIIFLTDGEPTFSIFNEKMTYNKQVQVGTKTECILGILFCSEKPVYETKQVTEDVPVHYELYGSGKSMTNKVYYELNGTRYNKSMSVTATVNNIRSHGVSMANKLAEKNIKLFSIGFGSDSEVDMAYLRELSSKTGVTARQANTDNISGIFQDISKDVATPAIDGEVSVDLSKFNGKVSLVDGTDARLEGNTAIYKFNFNFPFNQEVNQSKDISFPFSFSETGTYTFDNIYMTYRNLDGTIVTLKHEPVTIEVKPDAPPGFKGSMTLNGVTNTVDNLIKISNVKQTTNQFNVTYSLSPYGLINNTVKGTLSNLRIIQPLPEGISLIPSPGIKLITYNGKPAVQIDLSQIINYENGAFSPTQVPAVLNLQADWALSNTVMPKAILQFKDSRFTQTQETSIPASNQVINMKVRLNQFPDIIYEGDSFGIITKINDTLKNTISQTDFPNNYGLKNKPVKEMVFGQDGTSIIITYFDDETATIYLKPDFELKGKDTGKQYNSGDTANEFVDVKLSKLIPGKEVKYYYSINQQPWVEFNPNDVIPITKSGDNTITIKAEGGFALDNQPITKTIKILKKIESVSVAPNPIEVEVGKSVEFTVTILPNDATNKDLTISIANEEVANLLDANQIFGVKEGTTVLIIKPKDGSDITVTVPIHVKDPYVALKEIKFKKAVFKIPKNEKIPVEDLLIFNPANATNKAIADVTTTMKDKVAVTKENGTWYIIAKDIGYSTVKATAVKQKDGSEPSDSALFEVVNSDQPSDDNGEDGAGRW